MIPANARPTELKRLREELADEASEIIARSGAYLSEEDSERFRAIDADLDELNRREAQRDKDLQMVRSRANDDRYTESGDGSSKYLGRSGPEYMRRVDAYDSSNYEQLRRSLHGAGGFDEGDTISRAMAAVERAPSHVTDDGRESAIRLLEQDNRHTPLIARHVLMTGSPEYHEEFQEYIRCKGVYAGELMRTALSLTDANGGYLVPFTLDPTVIITNSGVADPIRSISTIKTIATDSWNGVTSAGVTAEWLDEGVQAADATPTFGQPSISPQKAAAWVFGSYEVLADSGFASELQRLLADAKTRLEAAAFATGNTGASQPRGVVAAVAAVTASLVSSATITSFVVGDVYRVADALRPRDAAQASWIANKAIYSKIRQFDTSGSSAFWANLGMGVPAQLLGQPQYECSTMGSVITTSANILLAGNFKSFYVVDRVGMSVLYEPLVKSTNANRPTGQAGFFAFWRTSSDVVDPDAFRLLTLTTSPAFTALG